VTGSRAVRALVSLVAAAVLVAAGRAVARRVESAREALRDGVSFGSSYVPPACDEIVYTRLRYAVGRYEVVVGRPGGIPVVLSGSSRTAVRGLANRDGFVVWSFDGNRTMIRRGLRGAEPPAVEASATWLLPGLGADGRLATLRSHDELETLDLGTGAIEGIPAGAQLLSDLQPRQFRFVQVALGTKGRAVLVRPEGDLIAIRLVSLADGHAVTLRESAGLFMRPRFAPDGESFTFVERTPSAWQVQRRRLGDGSESTLFRSTRFIESAEAHPDGRRLLLTLGDDAEFRGYMSALHVYELDLWTGRLARIGD
jgi:dipeptidyl aminopeptidase/acylaminoacyl peptidase